MVIHSSHYRTDDDEHNAKKHSPLRVEVVWRTKWWPNRLLAFLMSFTEDNAMLAYKYFCKDLLVASLQAFAGALVLILISKMKEKNFLEARSSRLTKNAEHRAFWLLKCNDIFGAAVVNSVKSHPQSTCIDRKRETSWLDFFSCSIDVDVCGLLFTSFHGSSQWY